MITILREYIDGNEQVTEYTKDGQTVSHIVRVPAQSETQPGESLPIPPTFEQRLQALETAMLANLGL
jgi:hypothetical protein